MAHAEEVSDLKAALEACENKWYDEGFANAENSMEPVVLQAQAQGFEEGWLAALQAMAVPEDFQLWNHEQIPRPTLTNPVQSQADVDDDEDTPSFRKPMKAIDTYVENLDLEVTSNLNAPGHEETQ